MVLFIVVASAIILLAAYFTYGKFLANTVFKLDDKNPVPSVEMEDGVDYVPAKKGMLRSYLRLGACTFVGNFGLHFYRRHSRYGQPCCLRTP